MASLVHLETSVISQFGVVDDDSNVVTRIVIGGQSNEPVRLTVLNKENWDNIYGALIEAKHKVLEEINKPKVVEGELVE